ncbi:SNF2 family N-terminal domain-containing protein [Tricladium varicosporioides]|nr:SNF2 family N-terminal domain-containing protein [Hymenoscyphus varicosporioides]
MEIYEGDRSLFRADFPTDIPGYEDILLALEVDEPKKRIKWPTSQGRIWTDFKLVLLHEGGRDILRVVFIIKWNTTTSPNYISSAASQKPPILLDVLEKYFPDPNTSKVDAWTPHDFYQSVHVPEKHDRVSASLHVDGLRSGLYPFQKRTVQWLLKKEGVEWSGPQQGVVPSPDTGDSSLPLSFFATKDALGKPCFVSHLFGVVTRDIAPFYAPEQALKGGILAEEMGLGKTVEILSLISLHKRPQSLSLSVFDPFSAENVRPTSTTLIVAPTSICLQWITESEKHTPDLKVMHYLGIKRHRKTNYNDLLEEMASADVVVSTYTVLSEELNFTKLNPEKTLRRAAKYPREKSPLMALQFFRVVMDEAQMIESGVSKPALLARMVPRVNSWCVTGTPITKEVGDLVGLLIFLRYEPFASYKHVWSTLLASHKENFRKLFGSLALRHSKQIVRSELRLPAQHRYVITMPFTPIEEQHYQELFNQMCDDAGLDTQGAPLTDTWEADQAADSMRRWLVRLRQTALHPQVGHHNRKALGRREGPLRTVDEVLDLMMEQVEVAIRTDQRNLLVSKLKRGQLYENSPRVKEALAIWIEAATEALEVVEDCREQLHQELERSAEEAKSSMKSSRNSTDSDAESIDAQKETEETSRLGTLRNRLRSALEVQHMAIFLCASAHFQIKTRPEMTEPDSDEFRTLEKLEVDGYEDAKKLRQEILQDIYEKADRLMNKISKKASTQSFVQLPEFPLKIPKGGIESRRIMEKLDLLAMALDAQANQLDEWREQTIQFLLKPLVDEDEGNEITGDEYEESTKTQDEVMVYVQALRAVIADRHDALTGQENKLIEHEVKISLKLASEGRGAAPQKTIELLKARDAIKPPRGMGSIRGIVSELKALYNTLRVDAENGINRAQHELAIVENQLTTTHRQLTWQTKATIKLEKEIELFTKLMNARVEYYRQLQQVSDMVAPYEGRNNDMVLTKMQQEEEKLTHKVAAGKAKRRYLIHLRMESGNPEDQRICVICRENFEVGSLTVCGHQFCKECIHMWWAAHHNCPVCKKKLIQADLHDITYKPQELTLQTETQPHDRQSPNAKRKRSTIYTEISTDILQKIKSIDLDGPSFTTKVDTLCRHLIWLRDSEPGAKSIIYSQFKEFLDVLALAFQRFRIGYASIDKPNGIKRFKEDPSVECFLLHARAHSSGLNLVNANHVFLCEPLLNTALELQAIARVDRIGQEQETNVWLYLVDGTVEESIHALSVRRRMEHIGQRLSHPDSNTNYRNKGKARELTLGDGEVLEGNLEVANSLELEEAELTQLLDKGKGGEMVKQEDLWECLFGGNQQRNQQTQRALESSNLRNNVEVARHLRAEAAEGRSGA